MANREFWRDKLNRNVERDRETDAALQGAGWTVIRFWEHESPEDAAAHIAQSVQRIGVGRASGRKFRE
jgi:DNA mismatch endonuclease (patch repair protein)